MRQRLQKRLQELKSELEAGHKVLANIDERRTNLEHTMLRIQGAIQVLEEELANDNGASEGASEPIAVLESDVLEPE